MIYLKTVLKVIDNSGGQLAECIKVLGKSPKNFASIGDKIVCVIQKSKPISQNFKNNNVTINSSNKVKKGDIVHAVVVRTRQNKVRKDGSVITFWDNACVLIDKNNGDPLGTRIAANDGLVGRELREKGYNKICSLASRVI